MLQTTEAVVITGQEKRRLAALLAVLVLAVSLPYLWAAAITPAGFQYSGLLFSPDDQNVHLMWARQAAEGHFLFADLFTTEHLATGEKPLFTNLFCWLVGVLSALTHLPLVLVYHALRVLFAALGLWWFYRLCARLSPDPRVRLIATVLAGFSSGAGWLREVLPFLASHTWIDQTQNTNGFPMMPEAFAFPSLLIFPLNTVSLALLALIFDCVLRARQGEKRAIGIGALAAFFLANIHTYDALPLGTALLLWTVYQRARKHPNALTALFVAMGTIPAISYQLWVFRTSAEFKIKALTPTPPPAIFDVLLSYGPLLVLAIWGALMMRRHANARLLMLWPIVILALIYAPLSFGRKMIEGFHLPLCFFAAVAIVALTERLKVGLPRQIVATAICVVLCISSAQFLNRCLERAPGTITQNVRFLLPPLYLADGDEAALQFLKARHATEQAPKVVLCMNLLGNYLPRESGYHAFVGHWAETLNFFDKDTKTGKKTGKIVDVQNFYSGRMPNGTAEEWLKRNKIDYVIEGFYETKLFPPDTLPSRRFGWSPVFKSESSPQNPNGTAIYAVPQ